jgi:hypothetical protein
VVAGSQVSCVSSWGVGTNLVWTVCVGSGPSYSTPWCSSPVLNPLAITTFDAPVVIGVESVVVPGTAWGSTRGNDTVRLYGLNFGVPMDSNAQVWALVWSLVRGAAFAGVVVLCVDSILYCGVLFLFVFAAHCVCSVLGPWDSWSRDAAGIEMRCEVSGGCSCAVVS